MKRTLALLIAVLMVVAMLPLSTFAAAGQALVGAPAPQGNQATTQGSSGAQQTPPAPTSNDYFAVYDENNAWVGYYATLAEADAALEDGYTLKILQSYTASATYTWGKARADKKVPIRYTVDGALAEGGNAVITVNGAKAEYAWFFEKASVGDQITLKNITMVAERGAIRVETGNALMTMDLTLENCKLYAGNSYYEVNAAAYAQQPATNDYRAVEANNLSLTVRGEQTVLRATEGEALAVQNGGVLIENGYFYSSAAAMTVLVNDATLVVDDAVVVNNEGAALGAANSEVFLRGGIFAVTDGAVVAVYANENSFVVVTDALVVAGKEAYAFAAQEGALIEVFAAGIAVTDEELKTYGDVLVAPFATVTPVSGESVATIVGEGTAEAPEHEIAVSVQETITLNAPADTALRVYDAQGNLIAYLPADIPVNAADLVTTIMLVPNGGKLVLDANIEVGETVALPHLFPKVAITIEGAEGDPASIFGAVNGYLLYISNSMDITLSNVELKNTLGKGVYFGSDDNVGLSAKDATLTFGEDTGVLAAAGEALYIASGATVKLEQNAFAQSAALAVGENAVVVIEGGAAFEMNGEGTSVVAPVVQGASALLSREVTHSVTVGAGEDAKTYAFSFSENVVALNGGTIALPGVLSSLHQIIGENAAPQVTLSHEVELVVNVGAEPFHFNNNEEAVELLDENGKHVGYYGGIAAAIADVKDGYTVKLLADHVEAAAIKTALEDVDWTLDGNDKKLYMPEVNHFGMEFGGKNTIARIVNLTLYAAGSGITVNPAYVKDGVGVIATDVFVYAGGSDADVADAFVGDPVGLSAFHVTSRGGELIIVGDNSGAYLNGQYAEGTRLIFNEGYLAIYGGKYEAPVSRIAEAAWGGTTTYIAGGEFIGTEGMTHTIYNRASATTMLMGGNFIAKTGYMFFASSGALQVYGGHFYHLSDNTVAYNNSGYVTYYGGLVYLKDADAAQAFAQKAKMMSARELSEAGSYTTAEKELLYGVNIGTALVTQGFQENTVWMEENEYDYGDYTLWAYTGRGEDRFGVYGTDLALALKLVGPYNGKVELLRNVDKVHSAETASRIMGPIAQVTLTSATEEHLTYASSKYSGTGAGDGYFLRLHGGTWILKNLTLANYGSQLLSVHSDGLSYAKLIIAEDGEISGHTSVAYMDDNTGIIVEEGGFANASPLKNPSASYADKNRLYTTSNIIRLAGGADATVYGSVGYYRDGSVPTSGAYRCINYNGGASAIAGTGEQCTIYLASTAKLITPVGTKSTPMMNLDITNNSVAYDILLTAEPGVTFTTDAYVLNATAGAQIVMDNVIIQNTTPAQDGSFAGGDYVFQMNGAGGVFKNMKYYGTNFMKVDSKGMAKQDALTITFEGENKIIGKSSATLFNVASCCNTDIVINDGYYYSEVGNIFYGAADAETTTNFSEGNLIINDGTFYKDNGNNITMFACLGSYDIVIEGGFFHNAYNALMFGMSNGTTKDEEGKITFAAAPCSAEITINGGEFEIWYGWLYSDEHETNETKLTINGGHVMAESGFDYAGTARTATGIMRIGGKCVATINGGTFETEEFATNKACDIIQTRHAPSVTINDWTVYHRSGSESAIRVMGDATVVINGGWMESNARFVVRTMGGKNTTTAVTTPSKAILKVYGGTMILNPSHPKLSTSTSNCVIGNGGSEQFGHIYIYGGQFINKNDADPLTPDSAHARQVLGQINPFGDFEIHGGIMIATAVQDYFFLVDANTDADGVAIPNVTVPIVKGVTSTYEVDGRTYYYLAYGIGNSLLVPELQTSFDADITESGNGLKFTAVMDAVHYDALITWARSHAHVYNQQNGLAENDDAYKLVYGMLITTVEGLRKVGGVVDANALREAGAVCLDKYATAADALPNTDGSLDISAVVENITVENNTVKYIAIPYVELTLGVGSADVVTERYYGEYNSNAGVASMASVAATLLRDNTDVMTGAYQYPSVTVKNAFNRYTVEQQNVLVTYLAHEHDFDNKGVCRDCGEDVAVALQEGVAELLYTEIGMVKFYKLSFKKDVAYSLGFTKDVVNYALYDENGVACALTAGMYTPAEDGTYYLRVEGKRVGNTQMIVSHIHEADYLGQCVVCAQTLSTALVPETKVEALFGENNFYFYNVALEANVNYSVALINGNFRLYDAQGNEQTMTNNAFTCTVAGTYYIVVEATYTAKGSICVAHVHQYDHTGTCMVDYCRDNAGRTISGVYKYTPAVKVMAGDKLFYSINMMAGVTYTLRSNQYIGVPALYNADGEAMALVGDSFACETAGTYYLVVDVQSAANAQFRFDASHGAECTYNNKGECEFKHINSDGDMETVSCGNTSRSQLYDGTAQNVLMEVGQKYHFYFNYASAGVAYLISLPVSGVNYTLYDADGNEIQVGVNYEQLIAYLPGVDADDDTRTADLYLDEDTDSILYLVVESTADEAQTVSVSISHVHEIDHTGVCAVRDTTRNQNCSLYLRKQLEADRTTSVEYVAGEFYYYELRLQKGTEYKVVFANYEDAAWAIYNAEGDLLADSEDGVFVCEADAYYYLVVAAAQNSTGTPEAPTTITVQSHMHTLNNKGECSCGYANSAFIIDLDELAVQGGLKIGQLAAGKYYLRATMTAGKTYTLKFSISVGEVKSFQLYGGANADAEKTMTDGAFTCEESGVYYYVVEITRSTAATDSIAYSVDGSVAHVHTFTSAYHYAEVEGKYYRVVDKCDEATCDESWSEEISALVAGNATEIEYVARGRYYYAIVLEEGATYAVSFANATATWKLVTADGTEVAISENGAFLCEADGAYYLEVVADAASDNKHGAIATITVAAQ